jgi:heme exporter protein C
MKSLDKMSLALVFVAMILALYCAFLYAPTERVMGIVQRIFYFHLASAWTALLSFFFVFAGGALYLWKKETRYDHFAYAAVELGVLFCTIVLVTGPIWAKPVWNVWWTWDPRLTSTFVLWLIYVAYLLLRASLRGNPKIREYAAIYGIIGFADVPLVWFSIRWWRTIHPLVISSVKVNLEPRMWTAALVCFGAVLLLYFVLMAARMKLERLREQAELLTEKLMES